MQLERSPYLRTALAAATCGLLGGAPGLALAAADVTQVESAALYYSEKDRVNVEEATAILTLPLGDEETFTVTPTIDAISGASPNGAVPTNKSQVIGSTITPAGKLPTQTFSDRRYAISGSWQNPIDRTSRSVLGADLSSEQDYRSVGGNYSYLQDFNNKLTTLTLGVSGSLDTVEPSGGVVPSGLAKLAAPTAKVNTLSASQSLLPNLSIDTITQASGSVRTSSGGGSSSGVSGPVKDTRDKNSLDALIGVTQVLNRRTLMQLNYSVGMSNGYLTDPYKILSLVNGVTGETTGYVTENRPDSRLRQSIFWKTVLHLPNDTVHLSYRYYWDDWNIRSNTVDLHYRLNLGSSRFYLEPQARYYSQTAAAFHRFSLVDGAILPKYASADYRLGEMTSVSYGLKMAVPLWKGSELSARAVQMRQTGVSHPNNAIGVERSQDLYPGLDATTVELSLSFKF